MGALLLFPLPEDRCTACGRSRNEHRRVNGQWIGCRRDPVIGRDTEQTPSALLRALRQSLVRRCGR